MHDQVKKLSSFGFKATFGGPEQDQEKILQNIEWRNVTFVYLSPKSELKTEKLAKYARKHNLSGEFDRRDCGLSP